MAVKTKIAQNIVSRWADKGDGYWGRKRLRPANYTYHKTTPAAWSSGACPRCDGALSLEVINADEKDIYCMGCGARWYANRYHSWRRSSGVKVHRWRVQVIKRGEQ